MELGGLPTFRRFFYKVARVVFLAVRGLIEDRCMFRASALTYITVLSLVPLLAFAFSVAKGLGAYDTLVGETIRPFLDRTFGTLEAGASGAAGQDLRQGIDQVLAFVEGTNVGSLGFFGLALLLYTVVKLLSSIEQSFNEIWGVQHARSLVRKLSDYLSIVVIVPIILVIATGMSASVQSAQVEQYLLKEFNVNIGPAIAVIMRFSSLVALWLGFTFIYLFMPNTRVRILSAVLGGVIGGTAWHTAQILHVQFQLGMANYNAIYSGFAAIPIFMIWIFVSWVTVLLGAEFAYAHQNEPAYRQIARTRNHDHAFKEALALRAVVRVAANFIEGRPALRLDELTDALGVPERSLEQVLHPLREAQVLALSEEAVDVEWTVLPARDLATIRVKDVLDALKGDSVNVDLPVQDAFDERTDRALAEYARAQEDSAPNRTMRELAQACVDAAGAEESPDWDGDVAALESPA